jgi:putative membrane-bound dehydrogenase-like protein
MNARTAFLFLLLTVPLIAQEDRGADLAALPEVADGFEIKLWAKEPLVRNPCALAFDARGRMCVGMGPQYRNPSPQTPPDSVYLLTDSDGDGEADTRKLFATGFNCIQSLAWHGRDLWVANSPDLTVVRDLDGDDVADEYVRVFTDLGNIEHALHGLNWAPDGRLYMSKGNSKGLMLPGRIAPKAFRELAGMSAAGHPRGSRPADVSRRGLPEHVSGSAR